MPERLERDYVLARPVTLSKANLFAMKRDWGNGIVTHALTGAPSELLSQGYELDRTPDSITGLSFALFSGSADSNPIPSQLVPTARTRSDSSGPQLDSIEIGELGTTLNELEQRIGNTQGWTFCEGLGYGYVSNADARQDLAQVVRLDKALGPQGRHADYVHTTDQLSIHKYKAQGYSASPLNLWVMPIYVVDVYLNHRSMKVQVRPLVDNRKDSDSADLFYVGPGLSNAIVFQSSDALPWTFESIEVMPPLLDQVEAGSTPAGKPYIVFSDDNRADSTHSNGSSMQYTIRVSHAGRIYESDPKIVNRTPLTH